MTTCLKKKWRKNLKMNHSKWRERGMKKLSHNSVNFLSLNSSLKSSVFG